MFFSRNISAGLAPISHSSEDRLCRRSSPGYMVRRAFLLAHFQTIYYDMHRTLKCPPDFVIISVILSHLVQPAYMQFAFPLFNLTLGVDLS